MKCSYTNRLINKLFILNDNLKDKVDIRLIKKAIFFAKKYHGEQKRQTGEPYYSHPIEVAYMVADYIFNTDIIITAILHDTIEDTILTEEMISIIFGNNIAGHVKGLTRIKDNGKKISAAEVVDILHKEKKYDLLLVKLFDRLHNMETIGIKSPDKIHKIVNETLSIFISLAASLRTFDIECKLVNLCYKYIHK